jgi:peptidoglycan lytic transglycosylase G
MDGTPRRELSWNDQVMNRLRRENPPTLTAHKVMRPKSPAEALEPGRAPTRPRGMRERRPSRRLTGLVRVVSGIMTLVLILMLSGSGLFLFLTHLFERPGPLAVSRVVAIPKGEGRIQIAERLEREGVISNRWVFVVSHLAEAWYGERKSTELKAGEYEIKKSATMREVLDILIDGKSFLYKISIPEGLTSQQIVQRIAADPNLSGELSEVPTEGALLPDTYPFSKGMARSELIARMRSEQERFLARIWEQRQPDLPLASKEEAVILASIVEKETGRADERDRVAGVFINRLRKGMRLQSDPTIIYGIAGGQGSLGRSITRADINQATPYNTYKIAALPPGPICNPGRPAIEAVLNPAKTKDLYFVADGTGGHKFSTSLKGHNDAVAAWRKVERALKAQRQREAKAAAAAAAQTADAIPNPSATVVLNAKAAPVKGKASSIPLPVRRPKR